MKDMPFDAFYVSFLSEKYRDTTFGFFTGFLIGCLSILRSGAYKNKGSSVIYLSSRK
jgi:hypothetical protein